MKNHCKKNSKKGNKKCVCCNKTVVIIAVLALLVVCTALIYAVQSSLNQVDTPPSNGGDVVVDDSGELPSEWNLSEKIVTSPDGVKYGFGKGIVNGKEKQAILVLSEDNTVEEVLLDIGNKYIDDIYLSDSGKIIFVEIDNNYGDDELNNSDFIYFNIIDKEIKTIAESISYDGVIGYNHILAFNEDTNELFVDAVDGNILIIDTETLNQKRVKYWKGSNDTNLINAKPICLDYLNKIIYFKEHNFFENGKKVEEKVYEKFIDSESSSLIYKETREIECTDNNDPFTCGYTSNYNCPDKEGSIKVLQAGYL